MSSAQPARKVRYTALAVVLAFLVGRTVYQYIEVFDVLPVLKTRPFAAYFRSGLVDAADWIRQQNPTAVRMAAPYEYDRYLYERLGEMLYPIPVLPLEPGPLAAGDLCVAPVDRSNPDLGGSAVIFRNECLRIFGALR